MATSGDFLLAITGDFFMAMDTAAPVGAWRTPAQRDTAYGLLASALNQTRCNEQYFENPQGGDPGGVPRPRRRSFRLRNRHSMPGLSRSSR